MFQTYLIHPLYNAFVGLIGIMPHGDAGLAIIALTLIMRAVLYPVFTASIRTQMGMQAMQEEMDQISEKYKDDKEALGRERLALMRKYKVNPLAGFGALIVQFILIIGLYYALFREGFPAIDQAILYSFIHTPALVNTDFFGIINLLTPHHILLAALVGVTQYRALSLTLGRTPLPAKDSDKHAAARMQQQMMRYMMPVLMTVIAFIFPGAVGLYFVTSNVVSIGQEYLIRKQTA